MIFLRRYILACTVIAFLLCILVLTGITVYSGAPKVFFLERFNDLTNWRHLYFTEIEQHTLYTIHAEDADTYLKAESNASASGLIYRNEFNVYDFPRIRWKWKAENVYARGNAKNKEGDDYPIRIYIIFKYDPEKARFWEKIRYKAAQLIYGEYPPHSSLNYIWANQQHEETIITSSYSERSKMILLQKGDINLGKWVVQEVNILADYQRAFGTAPPPIASIAIMNDSDNTGERSVSYIDYIEVYR